MSSLVDHYLNAWKKNHPDYASNPIRTNQSVTFYEGSSTAEKTEFVAEAFICTDKCFIGGNSVKLKANQISCYGKADDPSEIVWNQDLTIESGILTLENVTLRFFNRSTAINLEFQVSNIQNVQIVHCKKKKGSFTERILADCRSSSEFVKFWKDNTKIKK